MLVDGDLVTAVIDVAAAGRGTRAIDLTRLYVWCYDEMDGHMRERLFARIRAIDGHATRPQALTAPSATVGGSWPIYGPVHDAHVQRDTTQFTESRHQAPAPDAASVPTAMT